MQNQLIWRKIEGVWRKMSIVSNVAIVGRASETLVQSIKTVYNMPNLVILSMSFSKNKPNVRKYPQNDNFVFFKEILPKSKLQNVIIFKQKLINFDIQ